MEERPEQDQTPSGRPEGALEDASLRLTASGNVASSEPIEAPAQPEPYAPQPSRAEVESLAQENAKRLQQEVGESVLQPIRTYQGDVSDTVKSKSVSLSGIFSAEERRRLGGMGNEPQEERVGRAKLFISIGLIVAAIALVGGGTAYLLTRPSPNIAQTVNLPTPLLFSNERKIVDVAGLGHTQLMSKLFAVKTSVSLPIGSIASLDLGKGIALSDGTTSFETLTTAEFLSTLEAHVGTEFPRILDPQFYLGVHVFDGNQPLLILKTAAYEQAYVSMLAWESALMTDLAPLFGQPINRPVDTTDELSASLFVDRIIKNKDTRVVVNGRGSVVFLYSFLDRSTILITTNENTLAEVVTRLSNAKVVN